MLYAFSCFCIAFMILPSLHISFLQIMTQNVGVLSKTLILIHLIHTRHRYRLQRQVENELDADEASSQSSGNALKPFPWKALGKRQPRLPKLRRTMDETGNDPARAWESAIRTDEEKASEEKRKIVREDIVKNRVAEMLRLEREEKEERDVEQLLHELPMYEFPQL